MVKGHQQLHPTRDHSIPTSRGGRDDISNIVLTCWQCNQEKGSLLPEEYIAWREGRASRLDKGLSWRSYRPMGLFDRFRQLREIP